MLKQMATSEKRMMREICFLRNSRMYSGIRWTSGESFKSITEKPNAYE